MICTPRMPGTSTPLASSRTLSTACPSRPRTRRHLAGPPLRQAAEVPGPNCHPASSAAWRKFGIHESLISGLYYTWPTRPRVAQTDERPQGMSGGEGKKTVRRSRRLVGESQPASSWSPRGLVLIINTVLVGVGGVFVATTSILVTAIAAISTLAITAVILTAPAGSGSRGDESR